MTYEDERNGVVITRCGVYVTPCKQCERRLEVVAQPEVHEGPHMARCPVHGVGSVWRQDHIYAEVGNAS